jgi:NAD(P)-dependent dehydrogenase (short-subunit alcohol dehydrogenase family)
MVIETTCPMAQTYLLIGGGGGQGSAVASRLIGRGATVVIAERNRDKAEARAGALGAEPEHCDATDFTQVEDLVARVIDRHGPLDGIANFAGSIVIKPVTSVSQDDFLATINQNLATAFATVRAAARPMQKAGKGSIVLMSSCAARIGLMHHEAIAAAKGGVISLAQTAAASMASKGVRVNCVAPGLVDTPMAERLTSSDKAREASESMHALGRLGTPEDTAPVIDWLLSDESSWVTGQCFGIDGGLAAVKGR